MSTRLDRLLNLLSNGSTPVVRSLAANQLGQIALQSRRVSSTQFHAANWYGTDGEWSEAVTLLSKLVPLLLSKSIDTRSAAAQAIDAICSSIGTWDPTHAESSSSLAHDDSNYQDLALFDLSAILSDSQILLGNADVNASAATTTGEDDIKARDDFLSGLGLTGDMDLDDEDLAKELSTATTKASVTSASVTTNVALSAREKAANRLKRKREANGNGPNKLQKVEATSKTDSLNVETSKITIAYTGPAKATKVEPKEAAEAAHEWIAEAHIWPFAKIAHTLLHSLSSPSWEARHGAALGLAGLLKSQGTGAGKVIGQTRSENLLSHDAWSGHLACHLLQVLALDRFGDYVGDSVSAPVREAVGSVLFAYQQFFSPTVRHSMLQILFKMVQQAAIGDAGSKKGTYIWQMRHSGLLGLRFLAAAVEQDDDTTIVEIVAVVMPTIKDLDDDVRSAAAQALLPLVPALVKLPTDQLHRILIQLWDSLLDLKDDLCSSAAPVLQLLAELHQNPPTTACLQANDTSLTSLFSRLFPFFRHTLQDVRRNVLLNVKLSIRSPAITVQEAVDVKLLNLLVQNIVLEDNVDILHLTLETLNDVLKLLPQGFENWSQHAFDTFSGRTSVWLSIAFTQPDQAFDATQFYKPPGIYGAGVKAHDIDRHKMQQDLSLISEERIIASRLKLLDWLAEFMGSWPGAQLGPWLHYELVKHRGCLSAFKLTLTSLLLAKLGRSEVLVPFQDSLVDSLFKTVEAEAKFDFDEANGLLQAVRRTSMLLQQAMINSGKLSPWSVPDLSQMTPIQLQSFGRETFAAVLKQIPHKAQKKVIPQLQEQMSALSKLLATYESTQSRYSVRVSAAAAGALVSLHRIPDKVSSIVKSLMNSIKFELSEDLQAETAKSLASFLAYCIAPTARLKSNPVDKIIKNLCTFLCQDLSVVPLFASRKDDSPAIKPVDVTLPSANTVVVRGASAVICRLGMICGSRLLHSFPQFIALATEPILNAYKDGSMKGDDSLSLSHSVGQAFLDACAIWPVVCQAMPEDASAVSSSHLAALDSATASKFSVVRTCATQCWAKLAEQNTYHHLFYITVNCTPKAFQLEHANSRRGLVEMLNYLTSRLELRILPYLTFLTAPLLRAMTDPEEDVRSLATSTFAAMVKIMPLETATPDPLEFTTEMSERRLAAREFISQLMNGTKSDPYTIPVPIKAELRKYQHEGVSWLAFLAKYSLHGILCDDMGLGKTLQTIAILASVTFERATSGLKHLPSLVICPPTLTGHWAAEIQQYTDSLRVVVFTGSVKERAAILKKLSRVDVLITSYDGVRTYIEQFASIAFNYCVLDEGHIIKNSKTKLSQALKRITADHRLMLSGTPIQNNVLELWNLFDFLMPGFLGTEKQFVERYAKPISNSRDAKSSSKQQSDGALALEALHKQVLPFLLRRLKQDVLDDLPPKIIQDYYCDLSPLQQYLYDNEASAGSEENDTTHVFQSLQYLRKLVSHPVLVAGKIGPLLREYSPQTAVDLPSLDHAPKFIALQQILSDCGIGVKQEGADPLSTPDAVAPHRVLIFCQLKQTLDIIERELFDKYMPLVTYMRMDGDTPVNKRHAVVQTFNADPSIDVLLLTTHVGGLGLTLTGADVVIFFEHDWNPMKDLQAMDRAHRLGQKRVVNVYRLITRNTLEERIMGLQKFKLNVASSVVNEQNSGLGTMDTEQVLDLFGTAGSPVSAKLKKDVKMTRKELLEGLADNVDP